MSAQIVFYLLFSANCTLFYLLFSANLTLVNSQCDRLEKSAVTVSASEVGHSPALCLDADRCRAEFNVVHPDYPCKCDEWCFVFNDCCDDFETVCVDKLPRAHKLKEELEPLADSLTCAEVAVGRGAMVVTSCLWSSTACELQNKFDFVLRPYDIPVMDIKTGLSYRSARCAACNGVLQASYWSWSNRAELPVNEQSEQSWITEMYNRNRERSCMLNVVSSCPTGANDNIAFQCLHSSFSYVVRSSNPKVDHGPWYKNQACALCNGVAPSDIFTAMLPPPPFIGLDLDDFSLHKVVEYNPCDYPEFSLCADKSSPAFDSFLGVVSIVLLSLSILGLICRLIIQFVLEKYQTNPSKSQFCLCVSLLATYICFLVRPWLVESQLCRFVAIVLHFSFLCTFSWNLHVAGHITYTLVNGLPISNSKSTYKLWISGWACPFVVVALCCLLDPFDPFPTKFLPNYGGPWCWLNGKYSILVYFGIPMVICLLVNVILFIVSAQYLRSSFQVHDELVKRCTSHPKTYAKLFVLMGLSWILGPIAALVDAHVLRFAFVIANASHGIAIFIFVVLDGDFKDMIKHFWLLKQSQSG